jgi:uncharacterized protein YdaU (DUF1376 family)
MAEIKLEPLPWFAFNVGEYVKDTMRLTRDAHGAYLLLMLDYYGTATPCPDDDFILAALTKSTEAEWKQLRKMLAPFFDIREGHWYHNRIEREMREASAKHAAGIAAAKVGASARWDKERTKATQSTAPTHPRTTRARKNADRNAAGTADRMPDAVQSQSGPDAHLHKHPLITGGGEAPPAPEAPDDDFQVGPIPKDFTPDPATSDVARAAGMSVAEIDAEVRKFILKRQGQLGDDWQGSFALWIEREIAYRAKQAAKAPPRIEVNNARVEPTEGDIDRALALFAKGGPWSHRAMGPEPGQIGCRIPSKLIEAAGLDPKTGLKARKAS